ncbi:MAG TPA: STAS domain-containing protein [Anaerolineales bacterium]|nr:STAS domain-containing protein [Anaerolineales bacterium]
MEIKVSTENGRVPVTVLHVDGNIDSSSSQTFQSRAKEQIDKGARYLLVDLSHVPFVSSAGLRALHAISNELRFRNPDTNLSDEQMKNGISAGTYKSPQLKLLNLSPATKAAFETSGFDMYIETFTDMKTAIASFESTT